MEKLLPYAQKITGLLKRYAVVLCTIVFGAMYGYLVYTAGQQAELQPSETAVNEAYKGAARPRLDAGVAQQLEQLEASNVEVQAIFNEARNNPFSE